MISSLYSLANKAFIVQLIKHPFQAQNYAIVIIVSIIYFHDERVT
jgi:hypothetical protein